MKYSKRSALKTKKRKELEMTCTLLERPTKMLREPLNRLKKKLEVKLKWRKRQKRYLKMFRPKALKKKKLKRRQSHSKNRRIKR